MVVQSAKLSTEFLWQLQEIILGNVSMPPQFNQRQCEYLVTKLETAVQSALDRSLSSPEQMSSSMNNWKLVIRLAMNVKPFIQE